MQNDEKAADSAHSYYLQLHLRTLDGRDNGLDGGSSQEDMQKISHSNTNGSS